MAIPEFNKRGNAEKSLRTIVQNHPNPEYIDVL